MDEIRKSAPVKPLEPLVRAGRPAKGTSASANPRPPLGTEARGRGGLSAPPSPPPPWARWAPVDPRGPRPCNQARSRPDTAFLHDPLAGPLPPSPEGTLNTKYPLAGGVDPQFWGGIFSQKNPWGGDGKSRSAPFPSASAPRGPPSGPPSGSPSRLPRKDGPWYYIPWVSISMGKRVLTAHLSTPWSTGGYEINRKPGFALSCVQRFTLIMLPTQRAHPGEAGQLLKQG